MEEGDDKEDEEEEEEFGDLEPAVLVVVEAVVVVEFPVVSLKLGRRDFIGTLNRCLLAP